VELFVDADGDGKTYNELEIGRPTRPSTPTFRRDVREWICRGVGDGERGQGRRHAQRSSDVDKGWTAEAKIPLKSFAAVPHMPPKIGDKWRINLYRLDWYANRKINEGSAFSRCTRGFHNLRGSVLEFGN